MQTIQTIIPAQDAMDGAGVKIKRHSLVRQTMADPFLLLDEIRSDDQDDFIAGFPPHPHRGIETLTYMKQGGIRHEDNMGNTGQVMSGGVQWMRAGRGVIHGDMPLKEHDSMHGFQLWINLSRANKMTPADYRDVSVDEIPHVQGSGFLAHVIAGDWVLNEQVFQGPLNKLEANAHYLDLELGEGGEFKHDIPEDHQVMILVYEGQIQAPTVSGLQNVNASQMGFFVQGKEAGNETLLQLSSEFGGKVLILHGKPHKEPIANYGPFVMNTMEEIDQAIKDYQDGRLTG